MVKPSLFVDKPQLVTEAREKQNRMYLGIVVDIGPVNCFVPFESHLRDNKELRRVSQWPLPSATRPDAGLNFEKCLILSDEKYLDWIENPKIASSQMRQIEQGKNAIRAKLTRYINNYISAVRKGRHMIEFVYRYTTLHCFHDELGLLDKVND